MIEKAVTNDFDTVYKYMEKNECIGFVEIRKLYEVLDIINIEVNKEFRNKGIATKLIKKVKSDNSNVKKIMLEVNEKNLPAINLYKKFGFKEISIREKYYGEDSAIIMERSEK